MQHISIARTPIVDPVYSRLSSPMKYGAVILTDEQSLIAQRLSSLGSALLTMS